MTTLVDMSPRKDEDEVGDHRQPTVCGGLGRSDPASFGRLRTGSEFVQRVATVVWWKSFLWLLSLCADYREIRDRCILTPSKSTPPEMTLWHFLRPSLFLFPLFLLGHTGRVPKASSSTAVILSILLLYYTFTFSYKTNIVRVSVRTAASTLKVLLLHTTRKAVSGTTYT